MNAQIFVLVIYVEAITYLLLHNLPDCIFNQKLTVCTPILSKS